MKLTTPRDRSRSRSASKAASSRSRSRHRSLTKDDKKKRSRSRDSRDETIKRRLSEALKKECDDNDNVDRIKSEPRSRSRTDSPRSSSSSSITHHHFSSRGRRTSSPAHRSRYHERRTHSPRCPQSSRHHHHHHPRGDKSAKESSVGASTKAAVVKTELSPDTSTKQTTDDKKDIDLFKIIENYRNQAQHSSAVTSPVSSSDQLSFNASPPMRLTDNNDIEMAYNTEIMSENSLVSYSSDSDERSTLNDSICSAFSNKGDDIRHRNSAESRTEVDDINGDRTEPNDYLPVSRETAESDERRPQRVSSDAISRKIKEENESGHRRAEDGPTEVGNTNDKQLRSRESAQKSTNASSDTNVTKNAARPADNGLQRLQQVTVSMATSRRHLNDSGKRLSKESLHRILMKKYEIEKAYKQDCDTFATVVKMLVSKDSKLEQSIQYSLRENLRDIGQRCIKELHDYVNKVKQNDEIQRE